jgi:adenosine deaminase
MHHYLRESHPIAICVRAHVPLFGLTQLTSRPSQTDDILPFRNSLLGEYALLLAPRPHGLGMSKNEVVRIAQMGMDARFRA